jgi:hypothetical protein
MSMPKLYAFAAQELVARPPQHTCGNTSQNTEQGQTLTEALQQAIKPHLAGKDKPGQRSKSTVASRFTLHVPTPKSTQPAQPADS